MNIWTCIRPWLGRHDTTEVTCRWSELPLWCFVEKLDPLMGVVPVLIMRSRRH